MVIFFTDFSLYSTRSFFLSDTKEWLIDLDTFEDGLLNRHKNPDWISAKTSSLIAKKIDSLRNEVIKSKGDVDKDIMRVGLMKISALIGDGHTRIANYVDDVGQLPLEVEWFDDGLYITEIEQTKSPALGSKVIGIGGFEIGDVITKISAIAPQMDGRTNKLYLETYITKPGLLYGLGISKRADRATFNLLDSVGNEVKLEIRLSEDKPTSISLVETIDKVPLHKKNPTLPFWYEYDQANKLIYFNYNSIRDAPNLKFNHFVDSLMNFTNSVEVEKFIIDIRDNLGGNNLLTIKLVSEIKKNEKINKKGVLYCITNHRTFSAAICFAGNLATKTNVTFVGSEMGDTNNLLGDARFVKMKYNKIVWWVSDLYWENTFYQDPNYIKPEITHALSINEFLKGESPLIQEIINHDPDSIGYENIDSTISNYSGRYQFSPDKTLTIDTNNNIIKISGHMNSRLVKLSDSSYYATNLNLTLLTRNDSLFLQNDTEQRALMRLADDEYTPLELVENGDYENALQAYLQLKEQYRGELYALDGNNLATIANYYDHIDSDPQKRLELLKIAIELDPNSGIALGQLSNAYSKEGSTLSSMYFGFKALLLFDWWYVMEYGKAFGFI